jgi:Peptidase family M28
MARPGWLARWFTFTTLPVSILATLVFIAIVFSTVFFYEDLSHIPRSGHQFGVSLDEAYRDLQSVCKSIHRMREYVFIPHLQITALPHPYNSRQNDIVRSYILNRLTNITSHHSNIRIDNDQISNITVAKGETGVYFEGSNLLVHIRGTSDMPAILFSAHFDSVSTAPGATDDGMGVVSLLQLVKYFTDNRPKRDVIFNFNNAEEDGLYGAMA